MSNYEKKGPKAVKETFPKKKKRSLRKKDRETNEKGGKSSAKPQGQKPEEEIEVAKRSEFRPDLEKRGGRKV